MTNNITKREINFMPRKVYRLKFNDSVKIQSLYTKDGRRKANAADSIKDKGTIKEIKNYLLNNGRYGYRNYLIYTLGINIGRRAGDLLKLKIGDVYSNHQVKEVVIHIEEKTGKRIEFYLNKPVREALYEYITNLQAIYPERPLFLSQKKVALTVKSFWKILNDVKVDLNLNCNFGTHTMRKTFGYQQYQAFKDKDIEGGFDVVDMLQDSFGHYSRKQTMTYIGIAKDNKKRLFCENPL